MINPAYQRENVSLYLGDCLDILPQFPDNSIDCVVTDPPYGVNLGNNKSAIGKTAYNSIDDTPELITNVTVPAIKKSLEIAKCVMVWTGDRNMFKYPQPQAIGGVFCSAGAGTGKWGFNCFNIILYYGKDPYLAKRLGGRPNAFGSNEISKPNGHPCPKPIGWLIWAVNRMTTEKGQSVIDPFMGSGTTGVACIQLDRSFIGIELDPDYFNIAVDRIETAFRHKQQMEFNI